MVRTRTVSVYILANSGVGPGAGAVSELGVTFTEIGRSD